MKGVVSFVNEKAWNGKVLYSFKLHNDPVYYGCGTELPLIKKGDTVEFNFREGANGRAIADVGSIMVVKEGSDTPEVVTGKAPFKKFGKSPEEKDYWKARESRDAETQKRIQLQSSRNSAIAMADLLIKNNALKLPEAPAKRMQPIIDLVDELVEKYQSQTNGDYSPPVDEVLPPLTPVADAASDDEMKGW